MVGIACGLEVASFLGSQRGVISSIGRPVEGAVREEREKLGDRLVGTTGTSGIGRIGDGVGGSADNTITELSP